MIRRQLSSNGKKMQAAGGSICPGNCLLLHHHQDTATPVGAALALAELLACRQDMDVLAVLAQEALGDALAILPAALARVPRSGDDKAATRCLTLAQ